MTQKLYKSLSSLLQICLNKGDVIAAMDHFVELNIEELKSEEVRQEVETEIMRQNKEYRDYAGEYIPLFDFESLWLKHALLVIPPENNI